VVEETKIANLQVCLLRLKGTVCNKRMMSVVAVQCREGGNAQQKHLSDYKTALVMNRKAAPSVDLRRMLMVHKCMSGLGPRTDAVFVQ
jgi:hypothetical protein